MYRYLLLILGLLTFLALCPVSGDQVRELSPTGQAATGVAAENEVDALASLRGEAAAEVAGRSSAAVPFWGEALFAAPVHIAPGEGYASPDEASVWADPAESTLAVPVDVDANTAASIDEVGRQIAGSPSAVVNAPPAQRNDNPARGSGETFSPAGGPRQPVEPAWVKQVYVNDVYTDAVPILVQAGDTVEVVDRVWVTATHNITFSLVETWTASLEFSGWVAGSGSVVTTSSTLTWDLVNGAANAWHTITKTFDVASGAWDTDFITESLWVEEASPQLGDRVLQFQYAYYGVTIEPGFQTKYGDPNEEVFFTFRVTNLGNYTDTYALYFLGGTWPAQTPPSVGPLGAGAWADVVLTVTVPAGAQCGDQDLRNIWARSQGDNTKTDHSLLITRANAVYGVAAGPATDEGWGDPNEEVTYTLRVTNTAQNCADTFTIAVDSDWTTAAPPSVGPLAKGVGTDVVVTVTVPGGALCGDSDAATVTFTSQGDGGVSDSSVLTTTTNTVYGVDLKPPTAQQGGDPGTTVIYTLRLTNTGNCPDTFQRSIAGGSWPTAAPFTVGPLAAGAGTDVQVTVYVPPASQCGDSDNATVSYTSQGDGSTSASSALTTTANAVYELIVAPAADAGAANPGQEVTYTVWVTNTTNCTDTYDVDVSGNSWTTQAPATVGPLDADEGTSIVVTVTVPSGAQCTDSDVATVTFTSQGDGGVSDDSTLTTSANAVYAAVMGPDTATGWGDPYEAVTYTLWVTNTSNCVDTYDVAVTGDSWTTQAPATVGPVTAGVTIPVVVTVTVPGTALCGDWDDVQVTFTSQGDSNVSHSSTLTTSVNTVYGVEADPPTDAKSDDPGEEVVYTLRVTNTGNCGDTFNVAVSGHSWTTQAPATVGSLGAGAWTDVAVTVTVPGGALCGDSDVATVTFTSQGDGSTSDSSTLTTSANTVYGVQVGPATAAGWGDPGEEVTYTLRVTNTGNCLDTFDVAVGGQSWTTAAPPEAGPLAEGTWTDIVVTVTVPSGALCGDWDSATVTFTSQGDGITSDSSVLTTSANAVYGVLVNPPSDGQSDDPGEEVVYTLRVTNTGNCVDTFDVVVSGHSWTTQAPATVGSLAAGAGMDVVVTVTVPAGAQCGDWDTALVTFTSQGDGTKSDSSTLTTSANAVYGVLVNPPSDAQSDDPGEEVVYTLRVTNTGNCGDTFNVAVTGDSWTTQAPATVGPVAADAGMDVVVTVTVPAGAQCGDWDSALVTFTSQGDGTKSDSSTLTTSANAVYGVLVNPPADGQSDDPGQDVFYTLRVTNTGNCVDTFDVAVSGHSWTTQAPATVGPVAADAGMDVAVTVTVPGGALCGDSDVATVTFTSQGDGTKSDGSVLTTSANTVYGVQVGPATAAGWGDPGEEVTYTLRVTNTGNCLDTFDVAVGGQSWTTAAPPEAGPLAEGTWTDIVVTVTVPSGALCGDWDSATVTFTSQGDGITSDSSVLTTSANTVYGALLVPPSAVQWDNPGNTVTYTLRVTNTGNCIDTFTVTLSGNAWPTDAPASVGPLAVQGGTEVEVTVDIPPGAMCGSDTVTVDVESQGGDVICDTSLLTTTANSLVGVQVGPSADADSGDPGQEVVYTLRVTNTGNCTDTFSVAASGNSWTTDVPATVGPLPGSAWTDVAVTVTVGGGALCGDTDSATVTFTSQSDGITSDSSVLNTTANAVYAVDVQPPIVQKGGDPGTAVIYTLWVTNTGNCQDTFVRGLYFDDWPTSAPGSVGPLDAGDGTTVQVSVQVPGGAQCGDLDSAQVRFTSQHDGAVFDSSTFTTTANAVSALTVAPATDTGAGDPGQEVTYTLWVTNTGNCLDAFTVGVSGAGWSTELSSTDTGNLAVGATASVLVTVTVPAGAQCTDSDVATVTFTSQGDGITSDSSTLTTSANPVYALNVLPVTDVGAGDPGQEVTYTLWVDNNSNCVDTYDVAVSGNSWTTDVPATVGPVSAGTQMSVVVTVTVPTGALCGDSDGAQVTFTSQGDGTKSDGSSLTTTANAVYSVDVGPPTAAGWGDPDEEVGYTLWVTNTGNCLDTFDMALSGQSWTTDVPATVGPLAAGAKTSFVVSVTVPTDAQCAEWDGVTVTATSQGDGGQSDSSSVTTTTNAVYALHVVPATDTDAGDPGQEVTYTLWVNNDSNCVDTYDVAVSGNSWTTDVPATAGPLAAGTQTSVVVTVTVPTGALCGDSDGAQVTFTSQGDGTKSDSSTLATTANPVYGVDVKPPTDTGWGDPGEEVAYTVWVTNTGNCVDTCDVALSGQSWTTQVPATVGPLAAKAGTTVVVSVTVPTDAQCAEWDGVTVTATSQGDGGQSESSSLTTTANAVYGLTARPGTAGGWGDPGEEVAYTLWATNTSNCVDTYDVAVSGHSWTTEAPATVGPLAVDAQTAVVVTVTVPGTALYGDSDNADVEITSQGDGGVSHTTALTTSARQVYGVTIDPAVAAQWADPDNTVTYTLFVSNTGNGEDTFTVAVSGNTWATNAATSVGPLGAHEGTVLTVTVDIPPGAQCGSDSVTIAVTSQGDGVTSDSSLLTTWANFVHGLVVEPGAAAQWTDPGSTVTYTLVVTNAGNCPDVFDVTAAGYSWTTEFTTTLGPIPVGGQVNLDIRVTVSDTASCYDFDTAIVTVTSPADSSISDTVRLTTTANPVYLVVTDPPTDTRSGHPGQELTYTLSVTNMGNCVDTFDVSVSHVWETVAPPVVGPLGRGMASDIVITVTVPLTVQVGDWDSATVTFTSQGDPGISASSILTTSADVAYGVEVTEMAAAAADPGETVTYTLRVTNTANCEDTFSVAVSGNTWPTDAPPTVGPLPSGGSTDLQVTVEVPPGALCGDSDTADVTLTSQGDGMTSDSSTLTTSANTVYAVTMEPSIAAQSGPPGGTVIYSLRVTNTGTCQDTFSLAVNFNAWPTHAPTSVGPLAPGEGTQVQVSVDIPSAAQHDDTDGALLTVTSQGDAQVSAGSTLTTYASAEGWIAYLPCVFKDWSTGWTGPEEQEPNNTPDEANGPLSVGQTYTGHPNDQNDYFYFDSPGGQVTVTMWGYQGEGGQLILYDEQMTLIVRDWDGSDGWQVTAQIGSGKHYVRIYTASGFMPQVTYSFRVTFP